VVAPGCSRPPPARTTLIRFRVLPLLLTVLALAGPAQVAERPSFVVVMTDDQTYADMAAMPRTRQLIGKAGARFTRSYVAYPLCCPSRATYLTGQYNHNNGVQTNTPPKGGVEALDAEHTLPVWLSEAGYRTSHIGKYLNGYGLRRKPNVPPGWTDWHATIDKSTYQMYGYRLFENGVARRYGNFDVEDPAMYQTDVLRQKAVASIEGTAPGTPLFLSVAFVAPHGESVDPGSTTEPFIRPAPRDIGRFHNLRIPRSMRGERDVSDKPPYVRQLHQPSRATAARIRGDFRSRRESLIAVDEAVQAMVDALARTGRLANTYILFTSDNGFFQGEHRIYKGKYLAYDPSSHVPLLIRGPGIPPGTVSGELISNADLAPTLLEAAGATADRPVDGRSILPFARDGRLRTRRPILHEGLEAGDIDRDGAARSGTVGEYHAIRTGRYLYVEWINGARELYDRARDPHEMRSVHRNPRYRRIRRSLHRELVRLRSCAGDACRAPVGPLR
jgi:N-acetylglucosamine-6-sulfatase